MIHVAILMKPYLDLMLAGVKTVECRLTRDARTPYQKIKVGDRIYFKQSAGAYRACAIADRVEFHSDLTTESVNQIKHDYNHLILGEEEYWQQKRTARYATLILLKDVQPTDSGPNIPPSRGVAWRTINETNKSYSPPFTAGRCRN